MTMKQFVVLILGLLICWSARGGVVVRPAVRSDQQVPGMDGTIFGDLQMTGASTRGEILFQSTMSGNGVSAANDEALWVWKDGDFALAVRERDPVNGAPAGVLYGQVVDALKGE